MLPVWTEFLPCSWWKVDLLKWTYLNFSMFACRKCLNRGQSNCAVGSHICTFSSSIGRHGAGICQAHKCVMGSFEINIFKFLPPAHWTFFKKKQRKYAVGQKVKSDWCFWCWPSIKASPFNFHILFTYPLFQTYPHVQSWVALAFVSTQAFIVFYNSNRLTESVRESEVIYFIYLS